MIDAGSTQKQKDSFQHRSCRNHAASVPTFLPSAGTQTGAQ